MTLGESWCTIFWVAQYHSSKLHQNIYIHIITYIYIHIYTPIEPALWLTKRERFPCNMPASTPALAVLPCNCSWCASTSCPWHLPRLSWVDSLFKYIIKFFMKKTSPFSTSFNQPAPTFSLSAFVPSTQNLIYLTLRLSMTCCKRGACGLSWFHTGPIWQSNESRALLSQSCPRRPSRGNLR